MEDNKVKTASKLLLAYDVNSCRYEIFIKCPDDPIPNYSRIVISKKELKEHLGLDVNSENYLEDCVLVKDIDGSIPEWFDMLVKLKIITTKPNTGLTKWASLNKVNTRFEVVFLNVKSVKIPCKSVDKGKDLIVNTFNDKTHDDITKSIDKIIYMQRHDEYVKGYSQLNLINVNLIPNYMYNLKLETNPNSSLTLINGEIAFYNRDTILREVEGLMVKARLKNVSIENMSFIVKDILFEESKISGCRDLNIYYRDRGTTRKRTMYMNNSDVVFDPQDFKDGGGKFPIRHVEHSASIRTTLKIDGYVENFHISNVKLNLTFGKDKRVALSWAFSKNLELNGMGLATRHNINVANEDSYLNQFEDDIFSCQIFGLNFRISEEDISYFEVTCIKFSNRFNTIWKAYIKDTMVPLEDMILPYKIDGVNESLRKYNNNSIRALLKLLQDNSKFRHMV